MDLAVRVSFDRWDGDHAQYAWTVQSLSTPDIRAAGTDLRLGAGQLSDAAALRSLLDFLAAWIESRDYQRRTGTASDNHDLFPEALAPLADVLDSDRLAVLAEETFGREGD
jgi:hypothetical protein